MSLLAKVGGFLVVPLAGGAALRVLAKETDTVKDMAYKGAIAHAALAAASYYASEKLHGDFADFARGGMWGTGCSAAVLGVLPTAYPKTAAKPVNQLIPGYFDRAALPGGEEEQGAKAIVRALAGA